MELLSSKAADKVRVTISPYVFGKGRNIFEGEGFKILSKTQHLKI